MTKQLFYLAAPYSDPNPELVERRVAAASLAAGLLFQAGWLVFSPISHTHAVAKGCGLECGWEVWGEYDTVMMDKCDGLIILMLPGWSKSQGVTAERDYMRRQNKPITYVKFNEHNLLEIANQLDPL